MSVNKVILLGNVCEDSRIKVFNNGGKVAQFTIATNKRAYKAKDGTEVPEKAEFHNVVINASGLVDVAEKYVKRGHKVYVEGELRKRMYEDGDGVKRFIAEVVAHTMELLTPKAENNTATAEQPQNGTNKPQPKREAESGDYDLPF